MNSITHFVTALRGLHRGVLFGVLMVSAWVPVALPDRPLIVGLVTITAATVFFVATSSRTDNASSAETNDYPDSGPHAKVD